VAAWSERLFGSPAHGAAGAFVFVFGSFQASLFPYTWGGLPSVLSMWLALAGLFVVSFVPGRVAVATAALLWGGVALTHHHAMVAILGGLGLTGLWLFRRRQRRESGGRLLLALAGAGVVAVGFVVPLALRVTRLHETGVTAYSEGFSWPWEHAWSWGPGLVVVAGVGLCLRGPDESRGERGLLIGLGSFWLAAFVALDYGGRLVSQLLGRVEPATPFTPSRFMLDLQFLLAIFGGAGLVAILRRIRPAPLGVLVLAAIAGWSVWRMQPRWRPVPQDAFVPIGRVIREKLPADAFVLVAGPQDHWLTYVCHRETPALFIPISEPGQGSRQQLKRQLIERAGVESWDEWRERLGKPIYAVGRASERMLGRPPIHTAGGLGVFELSAGSAESP
jgi:hypothetical protein